jgi:hypothetical protein
MFSTPGITLTSPTGFPIISTLLEQFPTKDVALLAACLTLLVASLPGRALARAAASRTGSMRRSIAAWLTALGQRLLDASLSGIGNRLSVRPE